MQTQREKTLPLACRRFRLASLHLLCAALACLCIPNTSLAQSRVRPRVRPPVPATDRTPRPRPSPTPAKALPTITLDLTTSGLAKNVGATTPGQTVLLPEEYRNMRPPDVESEIRRLHDTAQHLTTGSRERRYADELAQLLQIRLQTGIMPDEYVAQITSGVAELRNLPVKEPVRFRVLDRNELRRMLNSKIHEELPANYLPNLEFVLKVLGAIPETTDLRSTLVGLLSEQIGGLYDRDTKVLYIMKDFDFNRALSRIILAHEICHALQDQNFDLKKMPLTDPVNDDLSMAVSSVVEGDAVIAMQDYAQDTFSGRDIIQLLDVFKLDQRALNNAPYFLQQELLFPYLTGANFVLKLMYTNPRLRDRALRQWPLSTEQLIHPEKYLSSDRDDPVSVTLPDLSSSLGAGWRMEFCNVFGELQTKLLFENWREWDTARDASEGWGGDEYNLYRNGDRYFLLWVSTWDSDEDADEFFRGISNLEKTKRYRTSFENTPFGGDVFLRTLESAGNPQTSVSLSLRFRKSGDTVICEFTDSPEALQRIIGDDEKLFATTKNKPAHPARGAAETTGTADQPTTVAVSNSR